MRDSLVEARPVRCPELFGNDDVDALADRFLRSESENRFGTAVPELDDPVRSAYTMASCMLATMAAATAPVSL